MQGWMIALIIVAAVVLVVALAFALGSFFAVKSILGRRKKPIKNEFPEKYAVDVSWFDTVKDCTETVEITAYDGIKLRALIIKHDGENVRRVAVCQHGYNATPRSMQPYARIFYDKGYDVLLPAARAHSISEGKYVGMAWLDRFDVMRWFDKVIEMYGASVKIALMGVSMGGATAVAVAGMNPPPQVKCVIDDCGFSSQREEYFACLRKVPLPKKLALLPLAVGVRFACGYSVYEADIVPLAQKATLPALFFHGEKDVFVPVELGRKLFDAYGSEDKRFYAVAEAEHAAAYAADKEGYTAALTEFVDKHVGA